MTPHQILIVGIRLLAIFWLVGMLHQLATSVAALMAMGEDMLTWALATWASIAIQTIFCALLWFFPATLASKLLRGGDSPVVSVGIPFSEWRETFVQRSRSVDVRTDGRGANAETEAP